MLDGWKETNEDYSGQGHRRNMLSPDVKYVGIGHVIYNNCHYWVQVFSDTASGVGTTSTTDTNETVTVAVSSDNITGIVVEPGATSLTTTYNDSVSLPETTVGLYIKDSWPSTIRPVITECIWESADETIASVVSNLDIRGENAGSTTVSVSALGVTADVPVTVKPLTLTSCTTENAEYNYTGKPFVPPLAAFVGNYSVDFSGYTVSYSDNVNAGTCTVTVTGKGNYTGTVKTTFTIKPSSLTSCRVADGEVIYNGEPQTPALEVFGGNGSIIDPANYTVSYSDNVNAGTGTVTATGKGNYTGTVKIFFTIRPADIEKYISVSVIADQIYTGSAVKPAVTVTNDQEEKLIKGTDYEVTYEDNIEPGTATAVITGKNNYTGTIRKTFQILEKKTESGSSIGSDAAGSSSADNDADGGSSTGSSSADNNLKENGSKSVPDIGTEVKNTAGNGYYKVTAYAKNGTPEVQYTKPISKKKTVVTIPATVKIDGTTCKVTSVAAKAFKNNKYIKTVTIGKNVTTIGSNAFYGCTKLTKVTFGTNVKTIGSNAFYGCTKLAQVTLGGKITTIGSKAFAGCTNLKKVTLGSKVEKIGTSAFSGCKKLTGVTIGKNVTTIGTKAFYKCTAFKKITIPSKVAKIGKQAFYGCKNLKTITIKTTKLSKKKVGSKAFSGIYKKATITVPKSKYKTYKSMLRARGVSKKAKIKK